MIENSSQMWLWLAAVMLPAAILSGLRLFVLDRRARVQRLRLETFRGPIRTDVSSRSRWEDFGRRFVPLVGKDQERLLKSLVATGFKRHGSLASFMAIKATSAIGSGALTFLFPVFSSSLMQLGIVSISVILGWRLPDIVLNHLVRRRRMRIEDGVPDALDLLVICAESGLSLNQAIEEISRQMQASNPEVADEFALTSAEMRILPDFAQAFDNLVERTGLINLRGLIATLKQSLQFGTSLAESVRIVASEMRAERNARMEARAARLPVLLAVPMMAFILPCLLMIIGTPVALRIIDAFKNVHFGGISH